MPPSCYRSSRRRLWIIRWPHHDPVEYPSPPSSKSPTGLRSVVILLTNRSGVWVSPVVAEVGVQVGAAGEEVLAV